MYNEPSVVIWFSLATNTVASGRPLICLLGLSNDYKFVNDQREYKNALHFADMARTIPRS